MELDHLISLNFGVVLEAGLNLDLLCIQQFDTAPFCENYAMLYFDAKHLEKGLNMG